MSRDELATLVNAWLHRTTGEVFALDERAIGRWERGRVKQPSEHYRAALRAILGVEQDWQLGFGDPPASVTLLPTEGSGAPPEVEEIRTMAASVHAADRRLGGEQLYASVLAFLQVDVARALFAPAAGRGVYAAAASLTEIVGWMAHDSGRDVDARVHFDGAYRLALAACSPVLAANMCASMSHLAGQLGMVPDALRLADVGLDLATRTTGVARVSARLLAMRAKALAASGDALGCRDALTRAEHALGGHDDDEHAGWAAHFDDGSLAAETATALHLLRDLSSAERHATTVLQLRRGDRIRAQAFGRLTLAGVVLDAGRLDEAADLGRQIAVVAPTLSSARVRMRLGRLAMALRAQPRNEGAAAFLGEMNALNVDSSSAMDAWPV
jgi:hypothetical protein